jgi:endonuclease III
MNTEGAIMNLTDKQVRALAMRTNGKKLREIATELGITAGRARQLIERAKLIQQQSTWAEGLPSRYVTALLARGINTRRQLEDAVADGSLARMPGIGPKCFETITDWLRLK